MPTGYRGQLILPSRRDIAVRWKQWRTDVSLWFEKRRYRAGARAGGARAAFVVGAQRSGTDMVIWTLDRSLDVHRYDENASSAFRDCRIRDAATRARLIGASNALRVIFKPVCDSHRTGQLLDEHAESLAIWVVRDYRDVANSAVQRWGDVNLEWLREVARGEGDWGRVQWNRDLITPENARRVAEWCDGELNPHGAAAVFWWMVNSTLFSQGLERDRRVRLVRYEQLVTEPEREIRALCEFLGVSYREQMVSWIFRSSVRKRAKAPIAPAVEQACEELLSRLDAARAATSPRCGDSAVAPAGAA